MSASMPHSEESNPSTASTFKVLFRIALGALIPLLTGASYLVGVAYHRAYLDVFRAPSNLINKGTADYFLFAHRALTGWMFELLKAPLFWFLIAWAVIVWILIRGVESWSAQSLFVSGVRQRVAGYRRTVAVGKFVLIPTIIVAFAFYSFLIILFLLVMPEVIGSTMGRKDAEEDLKVMRAGCGKVADQRRYCVDFLIKEKLVAKGFVIGASEKYVIIFENGATRTLYNDGGSFTSSLR